MIIPADSMPTRPEQMPASVFDIQAPYAPGQLQPIFVGGGGDPGGRDDVAATVAAAQAAAEARFVEHQSDTYGLGSVVGDVIVLPDVISDHSLTTGGDGAGHPFEESQ